jgi:hypothetical protein
MASGAVRDAMATWIVVSSVALAVPVLLAGIAFVLDGLVTLSEASEPQPDDTSPGPSVAPTASSGSAR